MTVGYGYYSNVIFVIDVSRSNIANKFIDNENIEAQGLEKSCLHLLDDRIRIFLIIVLR